MREELKAEHERVQSLEAALAQGSAAQESLASLPAKVAQDEGPMARLTTAADDASQMLIKMREDLKVATERASSAEAALVQAQASQGSTVPKEELEGALLEVETQRSLNDGTMKELHALKASNESVAKQLQKAEEMAEASKVKIRELEASLKVTKAELTEAKTQRADGLDFLKSPTGKPVGSANNSPGLGESKWATADPETPIRVPADETDEKDRSAALQGTVRL